MQLFFCVLGTTSSIGGLSWHILLQVFVIVLRTYHLTSCIEGV